MSKTSEGGRPSKDFILSIDFAKKLSMLVNGKNFIAILQESTGGRPSIDYAITLSVAKEIVMLNCEVD